MLHCEFEISRKICQKMRGIFVFNVYNKVKGLTGNTPSDLIRIYRINKAKILLRDHHHTVADVADQVGFTDLKHFREVFKKTVGVTPSEYAKGGRTD